MISKFQIILPIAHYFEQSAFTITFKVYYNNSVKVIDNPRTTIQFLWYFLFLWGHIQTSMFQKYQKEFNIVTII